MSIVIVGGPKRGKTSLGKLLSESLGLQHRCTDAQRFVRHVIGTPDRLEYDQVSGWVVDNWMQQGNLLIEGVHAARALQKWHEKTGALAPVARVLYMVQALERAERPGQRAQQTKVENVLAELKPIIGGIVEFWGPDGQGGFRELPRVQLVSHVSSVQRPKNRPEKRSRSWQSQYR